MTDPSYADQIIALTFPHRGDEGAPAEDDEATAASAAFGLVVPEDPTAPSNGRAAESRCS